ncbi:phage tail sheath subtilisin-like domain-containing protein [Cognatishimia sp. MH4019]|uniref:phage tail sheath subtilisin-like domain-containing protein n=1 Tax=Cognatishimia sp. MH4019 TaxID=2854030 RepID=UPI001CD245DF|nr:phage tail sheath subtilisin-like domain-containing protein [Cognatishimia sp. MH4019]
MQPAFHKGIGTFENLKGGRPVQVAQASTVAFVFTAPDADNTKFPLNEPLGLIGGSELLDGMGETGTGPDIISQITAEGTGMNAIGVRVEEGADFDATLANVVGAAGPQTGVHAIKAAQSELGLSPRLMLAPGFTSQRVDNGRNPVVAEMLGIATRRRGMIFADGPNTTKEAALQYREDWGSERIYITDPAVKVFRGGQTLVKPSSASVAGITLRVDRTLGPNHSPSNHEFFGITGVARPVEYYDGDPDTEADYLTRNQIATIVRDNGFRLWGNETAWTEPLNKFFPVVRVHDIIMDSVAAGHKAFRDKPFSLQLLVDIAETVNGFLRQMRARGWTLGYDVWIDPALNTKETWVNGDLFVSYDAEAPAPLQRLIFQFNRNTGYYDELARDAISEINRLS